MLSSGMRSVGSCLGLLLVFAAGPVLAEPKPDEAEHWSFAGGIELGIFGHTGKGNVDGTDVNGGPAGCDTTPFTAPIGVPCVRIPNPRPLQDLGTAIVEPDRSREEILSFVFGATLEAMTPQVADVPTRPRFFMDVSILNPFTNEVGLAREANPGVLALPTEAPGGQEGSEAAIQGRGHAITVQPQGPQVHAGLGLAFSFDFGPERIRIKPSFVYSRVRLDVFAVAKRPVRLTQRGNAVIELDRDFRFINVQDKTKEVYHGIGPALEIEYLTGERWGPLEATVFIKGHVSRLFGDLETRFQQENSDQPRGAGEIVRFRYSQDRWIYRATTGIRFHWVPRSMR